MRKKADLSLNYVFLIFIATIAVFVIIGLITNWSGKAKDFVDNLFGKKENNVIEDIKVINESMHTCPEAEDAVFKHAKLCYTKAKEGSVRGELCYGIILPPSCIIYGLDIKTRLGTIPNGIGDSLTGKVLISYDYEKNLVEVN